MHTQMTLPDQYYMLVKQGCLQRLELLLEDRQYKVWPITKSYSDATRLIHWLGDTALHPEAIGTSNGQSLDEHMLAAAEDGCEALCQLSGWDNAGCPIWLMATSTSAIMMIHQSNPMPILRKPTSKSADNSTSSVSSTRTILELHRTIWHS